MKKYIIFVFILLVLSACADNRTPYYNHSHNDYNRFTQDRYQCIKETIAYADLSTANSGVRAEPSCSILINCMSSKGYTSTYDQGKFTIPRNAIFWCN